MTTRVLDYDPVTGMRTVARAHSDGSTVLHYEQDVEAELEACKTLANDDDHWKNGVKNEWLHYAHLPDAIIMQLFAKGINIYAHDIDMKRVFQEVNREYPHFKLTHKNHDKHSRWL